MKKLSVVIVVAICFIAGTALANRCDLIRYQPCSDKKAPAPKPAPKVAAPEVIVLEGVYFDTGSAKIKPESYGVLDSNAAKLAKKKNQHVTVVGYTDNVGKEPSNIKLSEARAASVKAYLESKGIAAGRISAKGMGPANPIADNATKDGRAKNRRIEMEMK